MHFARPQPVSINVHSRIRVHLIWTTYWFHSLWNIILPGIYLPYMQALLEYCDTGMKSEQLGKRTHRFCRKSSFQSNFSEPWYSCLNCLHVVTFFVIYYLHIYTAIFQLILNQKTIINDFHCLSKRLVHKTFKFCKNCTCSDFSTSFRNFMFSIRSISKLAFQVMLIFFLYKWWWITNQTVLKSINIPVGGQLTASLVYVLVLAEILNNMCIDLRLLVDLLDTVELENEDGNEEIQNFEKQDYNREILKYSLIKWLEYLII